MRFAISGGVFPAHIDEFTDAHALSVRELGRLADVPPAALERIESGTRTPRIPTLRRIAVALGGDVHELLAGPLGSRTVGDEPSPGSAPDQLVSHRWDTTGA